ncbi:MAG TPA: HAMP domain-containing sensor histidine kinase, partial [Alphaproteobacteria bacterium]|nr:HAMP domain-containing sensor histidine kinase [Alphaproteobacteria bacterium]
DMDFRIIRTDGETRFIRCEGRCEIDNNDEVIALYGIMQDVTESTRREIDLRDAKDSVERAYAAKTQFLANMSHELRTPLNAIIGFSEMMERQLLGPIGTEKYLEYIKGIRESGEHLLDLISDILDMSKIEAGKYELALEEFNIAKVIRMAIHMMEGRAVDKEIKINLDCKNENLKIVADRRAVMQMVLNLLSNAVKFSHRSGTVDITLKEGKDTLSITVKDQGIGIPANKLANITLPFEQAESHYSREYEGTGLGLSITKELSEIHGGNLSIESKLGAGTSVTIKLPYKAKK